MTNQPTPPLVPDWVLPCETSWRRPGRDSLLVPRLGMNGVTLTVPNGLSKEELSDLLPALAFFAEHGRLPTRDDQPKEAQGDE